MDETFRTQLVARLAERPIVSMFGGEIPMEVHEAERAVAAILPLIDQHIQQRIVRCTMSTDVEQLADRIARHLTARYGYSEIDPMALARVIVPNEFDISGRNLADVDRRNEAALKFAMDWADVEGDHHKRWVIDQIVRALTGDFYPDYIAGWEQSEGRTWDEGIAP